VRETGGRLFTFGQTRFFLVVAFLLLGATAVAIALLWPAGIYNFTCQQFGIPEYEKAFGFKLGLLSVRTEAGEPYTTPGVVWVDPGGAFARAGIVPGDVPKVHHGVTDLCGELSVAERGGLAHLRLWNGAAIRKGIYVEREAVVSLGQQ
jgi:hypothetical protein